MIQNVSEQMHTFFVPQMKQMKLSEKDSRHGSFSTVEAEWGRGVLWAHSIGDKCLFTFHDLHLTETIDVIEHTDDHVCISSMTSHSAKLCPVEETRFRDRNTVSYKQRAQSNVRFELKAGEHHRSFTFCFLPAFFDELAGVSDDEKERLVRFLATQKVNTHAPQIVRALESLEAAWAHRAEGDCFCRAKLNEIVSASLCEALAEGKRTLAPLNDEDAMLAHEAKTVIDRRYADPLTLQSIANQLYVGKTRLCSVFKREYGCCVAECLRNKRIKEAKRLLITTDLPVSEIARTVGYPRQSSFNEAFRRECGITPGQWRYSIL